MKPDSGALSSRSIRSDTELRALGQEAPLDALLAEAAGLRDEGHGGLISYSRKVFIPLTRLCRDVCHYCAFARSPRSGERAYLAPEDVLAIARRGAAVGCKEALFTLGDKPELRYGRAARELAALGHRSTVSYLAAMCRMVLDETGLLPHANAGVIAAEEIALLRESAVSQGIMLESSAERLSARGGPHHGSPDKHPRVRLDAIAAAGPLHVPFTTGILIGIGETRSERIDALLALRELNRHHGHLQEIIVQSFRAKTGTRMAGAPEPSLEELLWTVAMARLVFGPDMNIQVPPNLSPRDFERTIDAGINDWGGISPVTIDHVNPEAPWPQIAALEATTSAKGKQLVERLASYPAYCRDADRWHSSPVAVRLRQMTDSEGYARTDDWSPGRRVELPHLTAQRVERPQLTAQRVELPQLRERGAELLGAPGHDSGVPSSGVSSHKGARQALDALLDRAVRGDTLDEQALTRLFAVRGGEIAQVIAAADSLRRRENGDLVRYVVNRNINYTNVCVFKCRFCAFSKGRRTSAEMAVLRGAPYDLALDEIQRRAQEAWSRGATEVCMQGGIHPEYTGNTYLAILRAVKDAVPRMHVHAFSPLEVTHGAATLGIAIEAFLEHLATAGLGSLPGTAAEILDDEVRRVICPDKLSSAQWLSVMEAAGRVGLRATATVMFGHVERPVHWSRHLLHLRKLQARCGVFTEFVPLPFIHMEAPMWLGGQARPGPTYRETLLMHAVARLALHPHLVNIQASWVKMGREGARACLAAGANDLGGTLMNESISRAAGSEHGQELAPAEMDALIRSLGRVPRQRTTLYGCPDPNRVERSYKAAPLARLVQTPPSRRLRAPIPAVTRVT